MLSGKKIGFIGSGNMGEALISGLIGSGSAPPDHIICSDVRRDHLRSLRDAHGVRTTTDNLEVAAASDIVVYAVKPQIIASVLRETAGRLDMSKLVISIAAGVPLEAVAACLGKRLRLIRVMPNVAASVKEAATAVTAGGHAGQEDIDLAMAIFNSVGSCVFLKENDLMDAVTGLSGSGPAYLFLVAEAMADAGVRVGLARKDALALSVQTILGAARMLQEPGAHPALLKDMVTSPGGTTIAGLHRLEKGGLRAVVMDAVEAATLRSRKLGADVTRKFRAQAQETGEKGSPPKKAAES